MTSVDESRRLEWVQKQEAARKGGPLNPGPPGGTSDEMTDGALKPRVDFLHTAFLWLAGLMVTAFVALITVNFTIASNSNSRADKVAEAVSSLNREVGEVSSKAEETNRRLDRIEAKIDRLLEAKGK